MQAAERIARGVQILADIVDIHLRLLSICHRHKRGEAALGCRPRALGRIAARQDMLLQPVPAVDDPPCRFGHADVELFCLLFLQS